jgi:hypothetical protein
MSDDLRLGFNPDYSPVPALPAQTEAERRLAEWRVITLSPCPFCGNPIPKPPTSILGRWLVECGAPCGGAVRDYATPKDAAMAWNRRTP